MLITLIAGLLTGYIVSIPPLGPIAFALITKGFRGKLMEGLMVGTGAAIMDFIYAMIAFGGISLFISLLPSVVEKFYVTNFHVIQIVLTFAACVMVIIYGLKIMRSKISLEKLEEQTSDRMHFAEEKAKDIKKKAWGIKEKAKDFTNQHGISKKSKSNNGGQLLMGILLTMSSITLPASWFAIVGYIKGFGIINSSFWGGFWFSLGAFAGTALWFYTLLKLITSNKHRISHVTINTINVIAGYILIFLGIFLFIKAAYTIYS